MFEKQPPSEEKTPAHPAQQAPQAEGLAGQHEKEFSPEVIEKIMEKVQDIDAEGTAYHSLSQKSLRMILRDGLLGRGFQSGDDLEVSKEKWAETIRETKNKFIHFNIVGRARNLHDPDIEDSMQKYSQRREIGRSYYMRYGGTALVFDIGSYKEAIPEFPAKKGKSRTLYSHDPFFKYNYKEGTRTKEGLPIPDSEYGFVLSHRVAPRFFKGIVFDAIRKLTEEEIEDHLERERRSYEQYTKLKSFDEERARVRLKETKIRDKNSESEQVEQITVIMKEVYRGKENLLLPIYDISGNLLWPQKMTYEEVKLFVAEREEKKELNKKA